MSHVFISYSKTNRAYARELADFLLSSGFDVWIDDRIDFGANWERAIFEAVDTCSAIIVLMTPASYASLWVQRERQHAENRRKRAFPLLLEGEVFPFYGVVQYYDVQGGRLPEPAFLAQLAEYAPRHPTSGQDVAAAQQQQARLKFETAEIIRAEPEATVPQPESARPARRVRGGRLALAAALIVALAAAGLILRNGAQGGGLAVSSPTSTPFGGGRGEIAFVSDRDGGEQIYLIDVDGSDTRVLTDDPVQAVEPAWSPDGNQLVFTSERADDGPRPYIIDADGSDARRLVEELSGWDAAWSPDGTRIAFTAYGDNSTEIFVIGAGGRDMAVVTDNDYWDGYAAWSPDGAQIVFVAGRGDQDDLYIMDWYGGNVRSLTDDLAEDRAPTWSPDGAWIAFHQATSDEVDGRLCLIRPDGSDYHCFLGGDDDVHNPAWSPDGTQIVFSSYRGSSPGKDLYIVGVDGTGLRRLTNDLGEDDQPAWRP